MSNLPPYIISFFSGAGFLDLGFENNGFEVGYINEYSKDFLEVYKYSRKKMNIKEPEFGYHKGNIEDFFNDELSMHLDNIIFSKKYKNQLTGFIGGPPCPDFSIGGKNAGEHGDNGKLTSTYFNLIIKHKPDFFVFENVEGLWRTGVHREFYERQKEKAKQAGYTLYDELINAISYGVPQDRKRIFLVGILNVNENKAFNLEKFMQHPNSKKILKQEWPTTKPFKENDVLNFNSPNESMKELTVEHAFNKNDVLNHPNGNMWFNPLSEKFHTIEEGDVKKKSFKRLHRWRYSPTAAYGNNEVHLHPYKPRRISVAEALSIQSLPKNFELPTDMSLSSCFKTIGNGVPYLAASGLAKSIIDYYQR